MDDKPVNRESLKLVFKNGNRPNADNFASLIDSMVNKVDDGISKNLSDGLILSPEGGESDRLLSFYRKIRDSEAQWTFELLNEELQGLGIMQPMPNEKAKPRLFFNKNGNVGVNTTDPKTNFEVNGILGTDSRVGTAKLSTIPADGKWHTIIANLNGCSAFEIMAQVGKKKAGKYALLHAHALSTFGKSRSKIRKTQAHYGWWWNKLSLRWIGSTYDYALQLRTRSNYGKDQQIKFHITKLWDNDIMKLFDSPESAQDTQPSAEQTDKTLKS
ncbi:MAG: hypothetical protein CL840_04990 [Crocinitomicaceae bacterium]|nr:hypothetical protein [Crocinitomicaceae bacterium]|tara:strand:+ start:6017 stop:6832 length:816 start_codon:yes stop_codon:yes gene_type:complete